MTCNVLQVCITMNTPDFECFSQKKIKITKLDFTTRTHQLKTNAYAIQPPMSKILYLIDVITHVILGPTVDNTDIALSQRLTSLSWCVVKFRSRNEN